MGASHFSGPVVSTAGFTGDLTGNITGNTTVSTNLTAGNIAVTANLTAANVNVTTNVNAATGNLTGVLWARSATAVPANTSAVAGLQMSSSNVGIYFGTGVTPAVAAAAGSLYINTGASAVNTRVYVQGAAGTAGSWIALVTVS